MRPPSVAEELAMEKEGALSSSVMVPVAVPAVELITAPAVALERATEKVSSGLEDGVVGGLNGEGFGGFWRRRRGCRLWR